MVRQFYNADIVCEFTNIVDYPFDENECTFDIYNLGGSTWSKVTNLTMLSSATVYPTGHIKTGRHILVRKEAFITPNGNVGVRLTLRRKFFGSFFQSSVPAILLTIIVFVSNVFYMEIFPIAVTVNVTCLLTISGIMISAYQTLPTTAKLKIQDFHLLKCLLLSTVVTLLQTIQKKFVSYTGTVADKMYPNAKNYYTAKSIKILAMITRVLIPVLSLTLDILYLVCGILYEFELF